MVEVKEEDKRDREGSPCVHNTRPPNQCSFNTTLTFSRRKAQVVDDLASGEWR